jgi:hypothetical protein
MTNRLPAKPVEQRPGADAPSAPPLKFSKGKLALAFAIAAVSDAVGAFATPVPPLEWGVDLITAFLLFMVLGRQ